MPSCELEIKENKGSDPIIIDQRRYDKEGNVLTNGLYPDQMNGGLPTCSHCELLGRVHKGCKHLNTRSVGFSLDT